MTVLIYGIYVMRSVIEEKSSRVLEVLLGSVSPMQLMAGKIIGVGAVGLTQIVLWAAAGALLGSGGYAVARRLLGDSAAGCSHLHRRCSSCFRSFSSSAMPPTPASTPPSEPWCNSDEEASQFQFPVTLPLLLCMVFATAIIRDPNTPLAFWLSHVSR